MVERPHAVRDAVGDARRTLPSSNFPQLRNVQLPWHQSRDQRPRYIETKQVEMLERLALQQVRHLAFLQTQAQEVDLSFRILRAYIEEAFLMDSIQNSP